MPVQDPLDDLTPAIGYIRVSMAREEMISPDLQRAAIIHWAARTRHRIVDWVEDLDKTGRNFKREIMNVIERIEAGEARAIAVWKYSRFGRTRTGVTANLARVEQSGGQLLSATEEVDAGTAIGRFQRGMIMEFNAFESDRAGEQWQEAQRWRREHGLPATGGRRFGYEWFPRKRYAPDGTITLQEERYEPEVQLAAVIIGLYQRYVAGTGFSALAGELNRAGVTTVKGAAWSNISLRLYMDSGFAAGYLRVHDPKCKHEQYTSTACPHLYVKHPELHHPEIITEQLWQAYLQRRDFTRTAPPRSRTAAYPLAGLLRCRICNSAARRIHKAHYSYIGCNVRSRKGVTQCEGFMKMTEAAATDAVLRWLCDFAAEVERETRAAVPSPRLEGQVTRESRLADAEAEVSRLERAVKKHMRGYAMSDDEDSDGTLEREYLATLSELRQEKAAAERRVASLQESPPEEDVKAALAPVAIGLIEEWDSAPAAKLNALLRRVISRVVLGSDGYVRVVPVWED